MVLRIVLFLALSLGLPSAAGASRPTGLSSAQVTAVRRLVRQFMAVHRIPGGAVALGTGNNAIWSEGFGSADLENAIPASSDTAFRTASIGKSITATAAMRLAEEGRLDLDAPIQRYCPRFPTKDWPITARDLISHTSGIRHYEGPNEQAELYNVVHYDRVSDALALFERDPLKQRPGADFLYSTWGYVTLGCVLEGASGEEFRHLIQRLIFAPAGMTQTRDDDPAALIPHRARGYRLVAGSLENSRAVDMSSKLPAGGWITTAPDLVRFMRAWMDGRLVSAPTQQLMLTPYRLPRHGGTVDQFGMGWFLDDYHGMRAALYGGGTPQVSGVVFFVPARRLAVAALFNLEDVPGNLRIQLAEAIADVLLHESAPNPSHYAPSH